MEHMENSNLFSNKQFGFLNGRSTMPGLSLTLVYSSTNMSKLVWMSGFWKPLFHKNMSNFWNNIFHKFSIPKSNFGRHEKEKCCIVLAMFVVDIFVGCVLIWPASQSSLSESSYWICLELLPPSEIGSFQTKKIVSKVLKV